MRSNLRQWLVDSRDVMFFHCNHLERKDEISFRPFLSLFFRQKRILPNNNGLFQELYHLHITSVLIPSFNSILRQLFCR